MTAAGDLRELAATLAKAAGQYVQSGRTAEELSALTKSSPTDMVTQFDTASERMIVDGLRARRPTDGIVGEEGTDDPGTSGIRWLIDPIDGTTNFFYGLPGYAVSIAACDEKGAVAGAVYVPATDELFAASRGDGATLNGIPIACSTTTELRHALVATGFSYESERRAVQGARLARILGHVRDVRRMGAAAVDLCYVAAGRVDCYYEQWLNPWDLAAGGLIAHEAGCHSGDFTGGPVRPAEVLVANPHLFEPLRELIAASMV